MVLLSSRLSGTAFFLALTTALAAGVTFGACSSTKASGGASDGGHDASVDADDDATAESGEDDVIIYAEAPSLQSPDGCFRQGATCMDDTTCCSAYCVDGGCTLMPRQQ